MSEFKGVADRTVVELFDLAKEQQAEIKQLKTRLAVYKEDMQKDAEKISGLQGCIENLLKRAKKAESINEKIDLIISQKIGCNPNALMRKITGVKQALRGEHASN